MKDSYSFRYQRIGLVYTGVLIYAAKFPFLLIKSIIIHRRTYILYDLNMGPIFYVKVWKQILKNGIIKRINTIQVCAYNYQTCCKHCIVSLRESSYVL